MPALAPCAILAGQAIVSIIRSSWGPAYARIHLPLGVIGIVGIVWFEQIGLPNWYGQSQTGGWVARETAINSQLPIILLGHRVERYAFFAANVPTGIITAKQLTELHPHRMIVVTTRDQMLQISQFRNIERAVDAPNQGKPEGDRTPVILELAPRRKNIEFVQLNDVPIR